MQEKEEICLKAVPLERQDIDPGFSDHLQETNDARRTTIIDIGTTVSRLQTDSFFQTERRGCQIHDLSRKEISTFSGSGNHQIRQRTWRWF